MNMLTSLSDKDRDILIRAYVLEFGEEHSLKIKFGLHRIQETLNLFTIAVHPREWIMCFLDQKLTFGNLNIGDHFVAIQESGQPISLTQSLTLNKNQRLNMKVLLPTVFFMVLVNQMWRLY